MAWVVELSDTAARAIERLDRSAARRILAFLRDRVATAEDPRRIDRSLVGTRRGLWRYRVGDHRLICEIQDNRTVVLVVTVGHRREVYR